MQETKYIFTKDGKEVEVALETWSWAAMLHDGTVTYQFEPTEYEPGKAKFHSIREVDAASIKTLVMSCNADPTRQYVMHMGEDALPIVFTRRIAMSVGTPAEQKLNVYCFGKTVNGTPLYNFILPDGNLVTTEDRNLPLINT